MNFDPLDPFAKKKDSKKSLDEVFKKTSGGGRVKRDAGGEAAIALEKEA